MAEAAGKEEERKLLFCLNKSVYLTILFKTKFRGISSFLLVIRVDTVFLESFTQARLISSYRV